MFFSARISLGTLVPLCHRLATALGAGVDARTVWSREAQRARGSARPRLAAVSQAIDRGESLAAAINATGDYFPEMFRQLVEVGETTGHVAEVFEQLYGHYQHQRDMRRAFLGAITWPLTQLVLAVLIIGLLIAAMGFINRSTGGNLDPLGFGLVGAAGLAIYSAVVVTAATVIAALVYSVRRGVLWTRPLQRLALRVPLLGPALQTLAIARLAWGLHVTLNAGMDVRRSLSLSLRAARNAKFLDDMPAVDKSLAAGNSIYDAFLGLRGYPNEFLDALAVGEQSGRLVESMALLSRQYQERSRSALATLTALAGYAVWALVAALIIFLIFRLAFFYLDMLNDAMKMK